MNREDDVERDLALLFDNLSGPGKFYAAERLFWLELWRVPILEAVDDHGIEARHYGPIRAFAFPHEPRLSLFNILLGADRAGAVERGHLAEALDWTESLGLDLRVPVRSEGEFGEPDAAEDQLNRRGYRRTGSLAMFARPAAPPGFPAPPGIEVEELAGESMVETFSHLLAPAYGLEWTGEGFIISLPGQRDWRTYIASDASGPISAAAMMMHYDAPQLGFAGTIEECRGRGGHMALLHRQIEDAAATRASELLAVTEESLECPSTLSAGARNLLRAGFRLADVRTVWQPPEELIAPAEDEDEDEEERGGDDWDGEDEDGDEDHDFVLGG